MPVEQDEATQDELRKVTACVISGVESFMASPDLGPPSTVYADVMLYRVLQARAQKMEPSECAKEHLRGCLLHFELLRALGVAPRLPPPSKEGALEAVVRSAGATTASSDEPCGEAEEPLWRALDQVVAEACKGKVCGKNGRQIHCHRNVSASGEEPQSPRKTSQVEGASYSAGRSARESEAAMREFWDKYRTGTAKTTAPMVAHARA
eukprot:CAMPEP_0115733740 /NCGR_PEP_ID=MMETSP0272-20121206/85820_1 /TAXON_ID=71861 /ORGANISM="Scrippsiella trochoidea, Strain CCMP3099" /LENGTH=207 /DNA_ID=CAMNT_0003177745 /DNA_START=31 /DNA_END=650 /DNA_ORIENTATION=+